MSELEELIKKTNRKNKFNRIVVRPAKKLISLGKELKTKVSDFYNYITYDEYTKGVMKIFEKDFQVKRESRYQEFLTMYKPNDIGKITSKFKYNEDERYKMIFENVFYSDKGHLIKTKKSKLTEKEVGLHPLDEEVVIYEGFFPNKSGDYVYTIARSHRVNIEDSKRKIYYDIITRNNNGKFNFKQTDEIVMFKMQDQSEYCEDFKNIVKYYNSQTKNKDRGDMENEK